MCRPTYGRNAVQHGLEFSIKLIPLILLGIVLSGHPLLSNSSCTVQPIGLSDSTGEHVRAPVRSVGT